MQSGCFSHEIDSLNAGQACVVRFPANKIQQTSLPSEGKILESESQQELDGQVHNHQDSARDSGSLCRWDY
jgi:hypothetical protein